MFTQKLTSRCAGVAFLLMIIAGACRQDTPASAKSPQLTGSGSSTSRAVPQAGAQQQPTANDATVEFQKGKEQIEHNCANCYQAKPEQLLEGIGRVEHAISLGYPNVIEAHKLLVRGYGEAMASTEDQQAIDNFKRKREQNSAWLYQMAPNDPEVLDLKAAEAESKAQETKNPEEKLKLLEEATTINPKRADAQFLLALVLADKKQFDKAVDALKLAVENADSRDAAENYLQTVYLGLKKNGCVATNYNSWFEGLDKAYLQGPVRLEPQRSEFNRSLAGKLAQLPCLKQDPQK